MTLTTIGCPLFDLIAGPIREEVGTLKGVKRGGRTYFRATMEYGSDE